MTSALGVMEFSRAFLNGERGWCTVIKTYMDETGVHDDADVVAVAGYTARPKTWAEWTKDWNVHKRKVPAGRKPIKVYHATDCQNFFNEFKGWEKEERDPYVAQLLPVIPRHEMAGIVIAIHLPAYREAFQARPDLIEMFGTPYTACFQWAISIIMELATGHGHGERMAFVHERNDYRGECMKAFDFVE